MKKPMQFLMSVSTLALASMTIVTANAATTAGVSVTNNVTVSYQVGGTNQTDITTSDTFIVDRKINISVAEQGNASTSVSPNEQNAVTTFTVTNASNDVIDIGLSAANGAAAHGGTDNFDVTGIQIYLDDGDGSFDGDDTLITYLDEMTAGETRTVFIVADIPDQSNGDVAGVRLTGTAREGEGVGSQGAVITESATNNKAAEDTVFADADGVYDGIAFANDDYEVSAAILTAVKISEVLATNYPVTGASKFFNIPGATVQFCIAVSNAAGGATATGVAIADPIPLKMTFVANSILIGGTYDNNATAGDTSDDSCTGGSTGGSFDGTTVTGNLGSIAAGATGVITFQATID